MALANLGDFTEQLPAARALAGLGELPSYWHDVKDQPRLAAFVLSELGCSDATIREAAARARDIAPAARGRLCK